MTIHKIAPRKDGKFKVSLKFENRFETNWLHKVVDKAGLAELQAKADADASLYSTRAALTTAKD